jgi:hypothetical protein
MTQSQDGVQSQLSPELHLCTHLRICSTNSRNAGALKFAFSRRSLVIKEVTSLIINAVKPCFLYKTIGDCDGAPEGVTVRVGL